MGSLGSCTDPAILTVDECHPTVSPPPSPPTALAEAPLRQLSSVPTATASLARSLAGAASLADAESLASAPSSSLDPYLGVHTSRAAHAAHRRRLKGGGSKGSANLIVQWANPALGSFDSFGQAMLVLFVMSTGDGWDALMFRLMDSTQPGQAPVRNDSSAAAIFAVFWMFVGSFFAINLFVGVVVDNFNRIKAENEAEGGGSATMTPEQAQWVETMKMKSAAQPQKVQRPPANCLRRLCFNLVTSSAFDTFIIMVIIANVGVMACDYWGIENDADNFGMYNQAMFIFANIYYVEFCLKITGLGPMAYFGDNWCRFDFTLVCTSLLDQFAAELLEQILPIPPMVLRVMRVLRILRILRLLKGPGAKQVRDLIMTLVLSFPPLINVGGVLALVVFMYAVLGVNLFTYVVPQENLTVDRNFMTLGSSMLLLFQCLTGDNWSGMMIDAAVGEGTGKCSAAEGNCGSPGAVPFFISFMLIASFVVLNLVVAVILENFSSLGNVRTDLVSKDDIDTFKEAWGVFDPDADLMIPAKHLPELLLAVPPPMGLSGVGGRKRAVRLCLGLEVRSPTGIKKKLQQDTNGEVCFSDVLDALVQRSYKSVEVEGAEGADSLPASPSPPGSPDVADLEAGEGGENDIARMFAYETIAGHVWRWRLRTAARKALRTKEKGKKGKKVAPTAAAGNGKKQNGATKAGGEAGAPKSLSGKSARSAIGAVAGAAAGAAAGAWNSMRGTPRSSPPISQDAGVPAAAPAAASRGGGGTSGRGRGGRGGRGNGAPSGGRGRGGRGGKPSPTVV